MSKFVRTLLVASGLLVVGASVSWATGLASFGFVQSDGSIISCVNGVNGNVRFIDPSSRNRNLNSCKPAESQVLVGSAPGPAAVTVDCSHGQTITQGLRNTENATSVTITVKGTCNESVGISNRDNVTLQAGSPGAAIDGQLKLDNARNVSVQGLALSGEAAFLADHGSVASLTNVAVSNCGKVGVGGSGNSSVEVQGGSITGCLIDVVADSGSHVHLDSVTVSNSGGPGVWAGDAGGGGAAGGVITIDGATISNNQVGVEVDLGGSVAMQGGTISGSSSDGVRASEGGSVWLGYDATVSGSGGDGVDAQTGARVSIGQNAVIENSHGDGVFVSGGSSLSLTGPTATISGNNGNGVYLQDTSVAFVGPPTQITGNHGWGILCAGSPSVAVIEGTQFTLPDVTGNTAGNVDCQEAS